MAKFLRRLIHFLLSLFAWIIRIAVMLVLLQSSTLQLGDRWTAIGIIVRNEQFDYVTWEVNAIAAKAEQTLYGVAPFMNEANRSAYVRAYFADLQAVRALEERINITYADPTVTDPDFATAEQRAERDSRRASLAARQGLVESILEGQVASILIDLGFGTAGQLLPPISMRFTQVPNLLIVSPRDEIRFDVSINLNPMPVDEIAALENHIDESQNVSSLVVPLGGIALYPAMILETTSLEFAINTFAHEWLHHYLFAFPLGLNYDFAGESRIINETTANIFGDEVAPIVLRRYYPELAPPEVTPTPIPPPVESTPQTPTPTPDPDTPPPFDFGAELNETRITVDQLLAENQIEQAEAYMEERRALFVENGYYIRKINQAYFAFYGGYQTGSPGAGGSDPIGPAIRSILDNSGSLHDWIVIMRDITSREELLATAPVAN